LLLPGLLPLRSCMLVPLLWRLLLLVLGLSALLLLLLAGAGALR
jgi:hypothetical protein